MHIAIIGAGAIGSVFASHFLRAGHEVTLIARGARLAELESGGLRVKGLAEPQRPKLAVQLDEAGAYDLVLVTVLVHQVDVLLPSLQRSKARAVMFMFNTFGGLERLRDTVGAERFSIGFPAIVAGLKDGQLTATIVPRLFRLFQITYVSGSRASEWRQLFEGAGIPCAEHPDLDAWLKSHAAFFAPMMLTGAHGQPLTRAHAGKLADTMKQCFARVPRVIPFPVRLLSWYPRFFITWMLWLMSRTPIAKSLGGRGPAEANALLQQMNVPIP